MSLRNKNLVTGEYYHIYNRGNGKNRIFLDKEDYYRFMQLLYLSNAEINFNFRDFVIRNQMNAFDFEIKDPIVNISAWVLMPNHFHLIVSSSRVDLCKGKNNPITKFMHKVSTSYVMYFNKKYKRTGSLFEGKFKSQHVGEENYFNYLFAYIHLNPIKLIQKDWKEIGITDKEKAIDYIKKYKYSSFIDFFDTYRIESKIISKNSLPEYIKFEHVNNLFKWIKSA